MRGTALILCTIIIAGCSSVRKGQTEIEYGRGSGIESINDIISENITNQDFQIQKATVEITSESGTQRLIANMKFRKPGVYLLSLRSPSGIEAARFYITPDTILVNDRINKKLFHASTDYLWKKYGVSTIYLPVILGDLVGNIDKLTRIECNNGEYIFNERINQELLEFKIDCNKGKVKEVKTGYVDPENRIIIGFSKFKNEGGLVYARETRIRDEKEQTTIEFVIEKITAETLEEIVFIPGKNYEDVVLR